MQNVRPKVIRVIGDLFPIEKFRELTMTKTLCCLACNRDSEEVPLIHISYQGSELRICPQHLPILIHDPARLKGLLPDAENLQPADHHD